MRSLNNGETNAVKSIKLNQTRESPGAHQSIHVANCPTRQSISSLFMSCCPSVSSLHLLLLMPSAVLSANVFFPPPALQPLWHNYHSCWTNGYWCSVPPHTPSVHTHAQTFIKNSWQLLNGKVQGGIWPALERTTNVIQQTREEAHVAGLNGCWCRYVNIWQKLLSA